MQWMVAFIVVLMTIWGSPVDAQQGVLSVESYLSQFQAVRPQGMPANTVPIRLLNQMPMLPCLATAAAPVFVDGAFVNCSTDLSGNLRVSGGGGGGGGTSSSFGAAFPAAGTAAGFFDGTNMQGARVFDLHSGGSTEYNIGVNLRFSGAAGSVEAGTSLNPLFTSVTNAALAVTQSGVWSTGRTWTLSSGTDSVAAAQSGTWNINNISGTISLPTGAATEATLATRLADATFTGRFAAAFTSADGIANQTTTAIHGFGYMYNGVTWDRIRGAIATGLLVNVSNATLAVTQSGTWNINNISGTISLPTGAATEATLSTRLGDSTFTNRFPSGSTPANGESNAVTISRLGTYNFIYNGTTWDRWTGAVTGSGNFTVVQPTGTNLHIVCDSGCGGAATFADNSAFTFSTTAVNNMGAVVDDTTTNTVAENSAGAPRMNTNRILYGMPTNNAGTALYPSAAALADATANPTLTQIGTFLHGYNGTTWDRLRSSIANGLLVDVSDAFLLDATLTARFPAGSTPADNESNAVTISRLGTFNYIFDGATWDRWTGGVSQVGTWNINNISGTISLPTGAATEATLSTRLADATFTGRFTAATLDADAIANETTTSVHGKCYLYNGTTWDRCRGSVANGLLVNISNTTLAVTQSGTWNIGSVTSITNTVTMQGTKTNNNAAPGTNNIGVLPCVATAAAPTHTEGNQVGCSTSLGGGQRVISETAANFNVRPDTSGATAAAPPARANYIGGLGSGATGGLMTGLAVCDQFVNVTVNSATTTLLVTGVSGRHVRICSMSLVTSIANNVALLSGTGATCGTGTTGMTGGTTAATGWNLAANGGITQGNGLGVINQTNATGDSVCVATSSAAQLSGRIAYAIY